MIEIHVLWYFQCEWFFSSWDADTDVPADELEEGAMPVSGMNQELLTKAEHLGIVYITRSSYIFERQF